jgi:hypothetical protein
VTPNRVFQQPARVRVGPRETLGSSSGTGIVPNWSALQLRDFASQINQAVDVEQIIMFGHMLRITNKHLELEFLRQRFKLNAQEIRILASHQELLLL